VKARWYFGAWRTGKTRPTYLQSAYNGITILNLKTYERKKNNNDGRS
jgi:hypothetical protein